MAGKATMTRENGREYMSKKRKLQDNPDVVKVGNKPISLGGYLHSKPTPKTDNKADHAPDETADSHSLYAEASNDGPSELRSSRATAVRKGQARSTRQNESHAETVSRTPKVDEVIWQARKALPLWAYQEDIRRILRQSDVLVLVGETGSGKSTQVPQFLYHEDWCARKAVKAALLESGVQDSGVGGIIAITQPRRVAATTLAHRVSREVGTPLGKGSRGEVGYSVRFDHNVPRGVRIKFLTEGMLLQELLRDPNLRQYSAVIVDEIHERSVDVDVLCGFLKQILLGDKAGRGGIPLKVIIMSATANVDQIQTFFGGKETPARESFPDGGDAGPVPVQVLQIEGRQYPVDIIHTPKAVADIQETLLKTIFRIHLQEPLPGDILAFLTGQEEIEMMQKLVQEYAATLASNLPKITVFPLFGQLSIEAQQDAFKPLDKRYSRKVVLATNIAETSVTVPGVRYVIDCGKAKVKQFRPRLGMESLLSKPISQSSAVQRAGRAGRESPGKCYRLYTEDTFNNLHVADLPEILRIDVLGAVLTMKARGVDDVLSFPLMDKPDLESVERALVHLHMLGALADDGSITDAGLKMALFPISAPFGRVLISAADPRYDCVLEVIDIIACVTSGDDIFHQLQSEEVKEEVEEYRRELYRREGDLLTYLTTMQLYAAENSNRTEWCKKRKVNARNMRQALNIRRQLRGICLREKLLAESPPPDPQPFAPLSPHRAEVLLKCFLTAFVMKTALLAPDSSFVTTQGKHVVAIHPSSVLHGEKKEAIMFLEHVFTQKNYAKKVSVIQANWIAEVLEGKT